MKLYRSELEQEFRKKLFDIDTNQFQLDRLKFYEDTIKGELSVEHNSTGYRIHGILNIPSELTCDRCLTKFDKLRAVNFNLIFTLGNLNLSRN